MEISLKFNHVVRVNERKEKTMDYCDLGKRLRNERRKKKISQEQLAEMADWKYRVMRYCLTMLTRLTIYTGRN